MDFQSLQDAITELVKTSMRTESGHTENLDLQRDAVAALIRAATGQSSTEQLQASTSTSTEDDRRAIAQAGNDARDQTRDHTIADLQKAIRNFGSDSFVNNLDKVKNHFAAIGIDISTANEKRLAEIGILLYRDGAVQKGGVLEGLVEVNKDTTIGHLRGVDAPDVDVEHALREYLTNRAEIVVVSYKHEKWDEGRYGMSPSNYKEIMEYVRQSQKRTFLWIDKVRSGSRYIGWSAGCSLMYIAFPSYQMSNIRDCNRLWIKTERDSMEARRTAKHNEIPALRAYAVLCRNANRGDYDNCPLYEWQDASEFIAWAKRLMSKLFTGKLQWGEIDGSECFEHAAAAVLYNFSTLNVFLGSHHLVTRPNRFFGPLSSLDFASSFWPEPVSRKEMETVDVAVENAMDYYITGDDRFLAGLRHGPRGASCYRGTMKNVDCRADFVYGFLESGEVANSDVLPDGVLSAALNGAWLDVDESVKIKLLDKDLIKWTIFECVQTDENDFRHVKHRLAWGTKRASIVRGGHFYLY